MQQIIINVNPSIKEYIMFFLKNLPKNLVSIEIQEENTPHKTSQKAFGILKGKIKDPIKWQDSLREESERDVYKGIDI